MDRDLNVGLPVHGLDSISLASCPNVDMDETNRGLYSLGPQKSSIFMDVDSTFRFDMGREWDTRSSSVLHPTPMAIEACENFLFKLFPNASSSDVKYVAKKSTTALWRSTCHAGALEAAHSIVQTPNEGQQFGDFYASNFSVLEISTQNKKLSDEDETLVNGKRKRRV